jgi:hypothetical protein
MTRKKHLKELVRTRQEKTGESYTTALAQVRRPSPLPVEEQVDVTRLATGAGLACAAFATRSLHAEFPADAQLAPVFSRLRQMVEACRDEPGGRALHGVLLEGRSMPIRSGAAEANEGRRFARAVKAGVRGISASGRSAVLDVGGHTVVAVCLAGGPRRPLLWLSLPGELGAFVDLAGAGWSWAAL